MCLEILKMKLSENFMSVLLKKYSCLEYLRMVKTIITKSFKMKMVNFLTIIFSQKSQTLIQFMTLVISS